MADPVYETVALVASNAPVLLPIASALLRWDEAGRWRPYLLDATFFALTGMSSVSYHLCQSADLCMRQSITQIRPADHIYVWTLGTWVGVRGMRVDPTVAVVFTLFAMWVFVQMSSLLITTFVFPIIAVAFFAVAFIARSTLFRTPLQHLGIFCLVWGVAMLTIGCGLFWLAGDIEAETFWIWHSVWHVLAFVGLWLIWEGVTRYPYWTLFGTARAYDAADGALQRFFAWETSLFMEAPPEYQLRRK